MTAGREPWGAGDGRLTYFSQHLGESSTKRSIVISPSDVSRSTDIVLCADKVLIADVATKLQTDGRAC